MYIYIYIHIYIYIYIYIYITYRAIGTQVTVKNAKFLTISNIGRQCKPLLTSSNKSTTIKSINANRLGDGNEELKWFWRTEMYLGEKNLFGRRN